MQTNNKEFKELYDFIDRAVKSRKYPENTGMALKTSLKLFEAELNDEEKGSISEFSKNLNSIYQSVFAKNKNFSASSLATYKSRVSKVLSDYEKYGIDPTKMANWSPKIITRAKKSARPDEKRIVTSRATDGDVAGDVWATDFHVLDFEGGVKLLVPKTAKFTEALMDGELKETKAKLKEFAEQYAEEPVATKENVGNE